MKTTTTFLFLCFCFFTEGVSQNKKIPHLAADALKEGMVSLAHKDAWRYQQGDNATWAEPNFDDSAWHRLSPNGLQANELADNIWEGYAWWRLTFTMDSTLLQQMTRLTFRSWGAAEVYLDGKLIQTYGHFSSQAAEEINFVPRFLVDRPIRIERRDTHILAVRYSNHAAKNDFTVLKHNAPALGFAIGFGNERRGVNSESNYTYAVAASAAVTSLLLLLLCLHLLLIYKFPKDNSNLIISLVIICFLLSAFTNYAHFVVHMTAFRFVLIRGFLNSFFFGLGLVLLPYALSLIFRLGSFRWTKYLILLVILRSIFYFFPIFSIIIWDSLFIVVVFATISFFMFKAIKSKLPDIHFITMGAIGTTVFILIDRLYATGVIQLTTEQFYIVFVLLFICFPVGLSVYITSRYGTLFSSMEQEVAKRTFELQQSLDNLHVTQVQLTAKNSENELLLKEIHHRVKNNLEIVSSLLALQTAQIDDPSVQAAMLASQNRVHSMGIIHQKLYQGELLAAIEMRDYFINLSESILDSFNAEGRIKVECDMPKLILDVDTAISIGLITNELLTNSLKYAFNEKVHGEIKISLTEQNIDSNTEGGLLLKVSDDGIGKPKDGKAKGTGFGTQLINLLTKQLDGQLTYEINHGTIVSLAFKKPKL